MLTIQRAAQIERADANPETGEFNAILATEGEASDGHILSIRGLKVPASMPMLAEHWDLPIGSILQPRKAKVDGIPVLRVRPQLEMGGEGDAAATRRDLFHMIQAGHINAMSVRWDTEKSTRRINLPSNHQHFVDATKLEDYDPRRWGELIEKSTAREGSIVSLGADPAAVMEMGMRAETECSREFFGAMARSMREREDGFADVGDAVAAFQRALRGVRAFKLADTELFGLVGNAIDLDNEDEMESVNYTDEAGKSRSFFVPAKAWASHQLERAQHSNPEGGESQEVREDPSDLGEAAETRTEHETVKELPTLVITRKKLPADMEARFAAIVKTNTDALLYRKLGVIPK